MSKQHDLVIAYLDLLHKHRELIAATYHQGEITESDVAATTRGIQELRQQRALVSLGSLDQGAFRLNASLVRHLDEALQKEQLFITVGGNLADMVARLPWLVDGATSAYLEGRADDLDRCVDEFKSAVYDLADEIERSLQTFRVLTDTRFASVRTMAEKRRQNEWYIGRAQKFSTVLNALRTGETMRRLDEDSSAESLQPVFRAHIQNRIPEWRASLEDILRILSDHLFRLRQVEVAGRRLRTFHLFLRQNPDYAMPEIDAFPELPEWAMHARPLRLTAHPDPFDGAIDDKLADIAATIPVPTTQIKRSPKVGTIKPDDGLPSVVEIVLRPHQIAFKRFLDALDAIPADGQALSCLAWKRAQEEQYGLSDTLWLQCVYHEKTQASRRTARVEWEVIESHYAHYAPSRSGNVIVHDILARRAQ